MTAGGRARARPSRRAVALAQAAHLVPTALWPLLSAALGRSCDRHEDGVVARAERGAAGRAPRGWRSAWPAGGDTCRRRRRSPGQDAAAFAAIDIVYLRRGRLKWTYGLDAAAEIALLAGWALARPDQDP